MPRNGQPRITMVGFGEAAQAFLEGWGPLAAVEAAYDIRAREPALLSAADSAGVALATASTARRWPSIIAARIAASSQVSSPA